MQYQGKMTREGGYGHPSGHLERQKLTVLVLAILLFGLSVSDVHQGDFRLMGLQIPGINGRLGVFLLFVAVAWSLAHYFLSWLQELSAEAQARTSYKEMLADVRGYVEQISKGGTEIKAAITSHTESVVRLQASVERGIPDIQKVIETVAIVTDSERGDTINEALKTKVWINGDRKVSEPSDDRTIAYCENLLAFLAKSLRVNAKRRSAQLDISLAPELYRNWDEVGVTATKLSRDVANTAMTIEGSSRVLDEMRRAVSLMPRLVKTQRYIFELGAPVTVAILALSHAVGVLWWAPFPSLPLILSSFRII